MLSAIKQRGRPTAQHTARQRTGEREKKESSIPYVIFKTLNKLSVVWGLWNYLTYRTIVCRSLCTHCVHTAVSLDPFTSSLRVFPFHCISINMPKQRATGTPSIRTVSEYRPTQNTIYFSLFFRLALLFPFFPFIISIRCCSVHSSLIHSATHSQHSTHTSTYTHPIASLRSLRVYYVKALRQHGTKKGALVATATAATRKFMARMTEKKIFILSTIATAKRQNRSTIFQDENAFKCWRQSVENENEMRIIFRSARKLPLNSRYGYRWGGW